MPGGMGYDSHGDGTGDLDDLGVVQALGNEKQQDLQKSAGGFGILQPHFKPAPSEERRETARLKAKNAQIEEDKFCQLILGLLTDLLPSLQRETCFDFDPPAATLEMLVGSKVLGYCTELLRNDSLDDLIKHKDLYETMFGFLVTIGSHSSTSEALFAARLIGPETIDLLTLSFCGTVPERNEQVPALADCLCNLPTQSLMVLRHARDNEDEFASEEGRAMLSTCCQIRDLRNFICENTAVAGGNKGKAVAAVVVAKDLVMNSVEDEQIWPTYMFTNEASSLQFSVPGRFKRLVTEVITLQTSLPSDMFVRHCENRPDILKCVIIGPVGTPYENGMFEFDIFCGPNFPSVPPRVKFKGTGGGKVSINPNLYPDGKVCLSLLGTWSGEPWRPGESTLLQLLVSIQAMVFCAEPWYNEPGHEAGYEQKYEGSLSERYNSRIQNDTIRYAMLEWIEASPPLWEDVVAYHFTQKGDAILKTVERWTNEKAGKSNSSVTRHLTSFIAAGLPPFDIEEPFMDDDEDARVAAKRSLDDSMLPRLQTALQGFGATYKNQHYASPIEQQTTPRRRLKLQPSPSDKTSSSSCPGSASFLAGYDETAHFQISLAQRGEFTSSSSSPSGTVFTNMTQGLSSNPSGPIADQQSSSVRGGHSVGSAFGPPSSNTRSATRGRGHGIDANLRSGWGGSNGSVYSVAQYGRGRGGLGSDNAVRSLADYVPSLPPVEGYRRGSSSYYRGRGGYGGYGGHGDHGSGRGDTGERGGHEGG